MGNNGSRAGNITLRQPLEPEQQWAHSFPRSPPRIVQPKVLPDRDAVTKLRSTNNGDILHSGGTISGRHQQQTLSLEREDKSFRIFRTNSISSIPSDEYRQEKKCQTRGYTPYHRGGVHRHAAQRYESKNMHKDQVNNFGSVPDLRDPVSIVNEDVGNKYKGKKKYKAPPPPTHSSMIKNLNDINNYQWKEEDSSEVNEPVIRRGRLFKTKADLKKKYSSPQKSNNNQSLDYEINDCKIKVEATKNMPEQNKMNISNNVELRDYNRRSDVKYNRLSLPEVYKSNGVPEFQAELKEVIQRIKSTKPQSTNKHNSYQYRYDKELVQYEKETKEKLRTLDHNINKKREKIRARTKITDVECTKEKNNKIDAFENDRGQPSGKESTPEKSTQMIENDKKEQPSKLFYFGMNEPIGENHNKSNYNENAAIENFATSLQTYSRTFPFPNSSGSDISSELEIEESQVSTSGIALQLRPILPKKQLEIPRFSPAAAWKLLSAVESNFAPSTTASDDLPIFIEDRIEKLSRPPPPPGQPGPRSSYDKSGDSGISGDAGPAGFDDTPEIAVDIRTNLQLPMVINKSHGISWTPQQDLGEEESSTDDDLNNRKEMHRSSTTVKFTPKSNVFSLSLPRDNHLSAYINKNNIQSYVALQKLKRSVSGVLGNLSNKRDSLQSNSFRNQSENWFLSKSAPNSLNNGLNSLEIQNSQKTEEIEQTSSNLGTGKNNTQNMTRVMYLPELDNLYVKNQSNQKRQDRGRNKDYLRERSKSAERTKEIYQFAIMSKSCENISTQIQSSPEPEDLQDPPKEKDNMKVHKSKRFTFQSTIRQIERRRIAEKLSREAEKKEKQRLGELEAMQRVEEEFQRKRAREKASIRQQLRLFSLDDTTWTSLPPNLEMKDELRSQPDGAVSSCTSSPTLPPEKGKKHAEGSRVPRKITPSSDSSDEIVKKAPMTQVLSEYRQAQREYKDFRGSPRYNGESPFLKQTTVHPQVIYNIPKATGHQGENQSSSNYRKQFAHGVKTSRSGDSTYSDDSQPNINSPKIHRSKKTPVSRF